MTYNGLIIGAGSAGVSRKEGNHAGAYLDHPLCCLAGIYDQSTDKARKAAAMFGCRCYDSLDAALTDDPHIVSVAVGPENQIRIIRDVCRQSSVRALFVEKPMARDYDTALETIRYCQSRGKRIYINYQRRADKNFIRLREELRSGRRGRLQSGVVYYTRGMWTNASHWIDLSIMLFGRPEWVTAQKNPIPSPYKDDPNVTVLLGYPDFHLHLIPLLSWERGFFTGDLDLTFEKERLFIPNSLHYGSTHIKRWKADGERIEMTEPDFYFTGCKNDFSSMLDTIVSDIDVGRAETIRPLESIWPIRIMEMAEKSYMENRRFDLNLDTL